MISKELLSDITSSLASMISIIDDEQIQERTDEYDEDIENANKILDIIYAISQLSSYEYIETKEVKDILEKYGK